MAKKAAKGHAKGGASGKMANSTKVGVKHAQRGKSASSATEARAKAASAKKLSPGKAKVAVAQPPVPPKPAAKPRHGLGRGLGALIGGMPAAVARPAAPAPSTAAPAAQGASKGGVMMVKTSRVSRSPWQPRVAFDPEALHELSESIKSHGVIQPLVCRRVPAEKGGGYELIAGERRLRAAVDAGLEEVPIVLVDVEDRDAAEMSIIENIQREDLNIVEEAEGYRTLAEQFGLTQQEVADRVGKSRPGVANAMRLLDLPDEVKVLLSSGLLSAGHAKVLLGVQDEAEQTTLARRCVEEQITVRALERIIERRVREKLGSDTRKSDIPESHVRYLLDKLHARLGAPVRLLPSATLSNGRHAKGSLEISFADNDDLTRLLDIMGVEVD
jgi:ParB family chromosome partitioning protein